MDYCLPHDTVINFDLNLGFEKSNLEDIFAFLEIML
jgi:hypothetical protein